MGRRGFLPGRTTFQQILPAIELIVDLDELRRVIRHPDEHALAFVDRLTADEFDEWPAVAKLLRDARDAAIRDSSDGAAADEAGEV